MATTVLHRVPYRTYVHLTRVHDNRHLRMSYHGGTLEIATPRLLLIERATIRLGWIVREVAMAFGVAYDGIGSTTCHRGGVGVFGGFGREPDAGFYFANAARPLNPSTIDLDAGGIPPDLWIEVDNRFSRRGMIPVFARLGVPEVWRYRPRTNRLRFLRLSDTSYETAEKSQALPMLTPSLVLEALALGEGLDDSTWGRRLMGWVRERLGSPIT